MYKSATQLKLKSNAKVGSIKKSPDNSEDSVSSENRMVLIVRHRCFQLFFQDDLQGDVLLDKAYGHRDDFSLRLLGVF
jgi:hypothetical protein